MCGKPAGLTRVQERTLDTLVVVPVRDRRIAGPVLRRLSLRPLDGQLFVGDVIGLVGHADRLGQPVVEREQRQRGHLPTVGQERFRFIPF